MCSCGTSKLDAVVLRPAFLSFQGPGIRERTVSHLLRTNRLIQMKIFILTIIIIIIAAAAVVVVVSLFRWNPKYPDSPFCSKNNHRKI